MLDLNRDYKFGHYRDRFAEVEIGMHQSKFNSSCNDLKPHLVVSQGSMLRAVLIMFFLNTVESS